MPCNSPRNLDISALRSFVTVAELGGVTRAAERLNLTQSAVSMQLKRLETAFDQPLMQRHGRGVCLTSEGEQLLGYGRRMVKLNDETWNRMMHEAFESRVSFGVPEDIVRPYVTGMLREFVGAFPRARINMVSSISRLFLKQFEKGRIEVMLTTEPAATGAGECLYRAPLKWYVGRDSEIFRQRPLPLAAKPDCIFLPVARAALEGAGISWETPYQANDRRDLVALSAPASPSRRTCPIWPKSRTGMRYLPRAACRRCRISACSFMCARTRHRWPCSLPGSSGMWISIRQPSPRGGDQQGDRPGMRRQTGSEAKA